MAQVTVRQLIRRSLLVLGVISGTEPLNADEAQDGLDALNALVASWANERLLVYHTPRVDVPLVPSKGTYTWGPGGDIALPRPLRLDGALLHVTDTSEPIEWPLAVWDQAAYEAGIAQKTLGSIYPFGVWLEASFPLAVLHVYFVPQVPYTLGLFPWLPFTAFASIDSEVSFPPGYERALVSGLAVEMAPMYGKEASATVVATLAQSVSAIKRVNTVVPRLSTDPAYTGRQAGQWDAQSDQYFWRR